MTKMQKILLAVTIILAIIVISSVLLLQKSPQMPPAPVIIFSPSPTPFPENVKELKITSMPTAETLNNLSVIAPITITFASPIDENALEYTITPEVAAFTEVDSSGTKLTFKPVDYWKPNTQYTLRINRLSGQDNSLLRVTEIKFKAYVSYDEVEDAPAERNNPL